MNPTHVLICGEVGVGKSTLIEKLLRESKRPLYGFITKKTPEDEKGESRVYIHPANSNKRLYTDDNMVGVCGKSPVRTNAKAFDTVGARLLEAPHNGLLLMDELGFMESDAPVFCKEVLRALDGDVPVLAAVKAKETPFLRAVRTHKNARLYFITRENRDALYAELLPIIKEWNSAI